MALSGMFAVRPDSYTVVYFSDYSTTVLNACRLICRPPPETNQSTRCRY
jgi:hypothetical protein